MEGAEQLSARQTRGRELTAGRGKYEERISIRRPRSARKVLRVGSHGDQRGRWNPQPGADDEISDGELCASYARLVHDAAILGKTYVGLASKYHDDKQW